MKKIITVSVSIIMVFVVFAACTKTVYEAETVSSTTAPNTELAPTQEVENYEYDTTTEYYIEESTTQFIYHSALEGCVIVEQDGSEHVVYQEKCEMCGTLRSGTHSVYHSGGTLHSSFYCPNCGNTQTVQLHSEMQ